MLLSSEHAARATFNDTAWRRRHEDESRLLETGFEGPLASLRSFWGLFNI